MSKSKETFIGAGSVVFTLNLLGDILSFPELAESEIALMDIDPERLHIAEIMAWSIATASSLLSLAECRRSSQLYR